VPDAVAIAPRTGEVAKSKIATLGYGVTYVRDRQRAARPVGLGHGRTDGVTARYDEGPIGRAYPHLLREVGRDERMRRSFVLLALCGALAAGCGAMERTPTAASGVPTANVAGVWTGSAALGGSFMPVTMTLTQNGTTVTGAMSVGGRSELTGGVKGSIQGELLLLSLERVTLAELTVSQDTMTGQVSAGLPVSLRRSK